MSSGDEVFEKFAAALSALGPVKGAIGVAVSGGGDSMALLCLMHKVHRDICVVSVDHGLRDGSRSEVEAVARYCAGLGVKHEILKWVGWAGQGNLQAVARDARRTLIADWAQRLGITAVALGHTQDDQAETFLMRLARGSGVDGLSGMAGRIERDGVIWLRPMLEFRRQELRDWLTLAGVEWADDPSNEDTRFDRVKARKALGVLGDLGLDAERLAKTALQLQQAREALEIATVKLANEIAEPSELGDVQLLRKPLMEAPVETRFRLLAWSLQWVSGEAYRPRLASLAGVLGNSDDRCLHGCLIRHEGECMVLRREPAGVGEAVAVGQIWDGRWQTSGPNGAKVRALGENGLKQCVDWRNFGHNRETLLTTPTFWNGEELLANPFVKPVASCKATLRGGKIAYFKNIVRR